MNGKRTMASAEPPRSVTDRERLDAFVADGWLRSSRHPDADLWIYNYTEQTQYKNHWTPETLMCRGLILDADGGIVARPFPKFFNYGAPGGDTLNERYTVTEKIDGSLGILYWLDDEPWIATRGSFVSDQAKVGTELIREFWPDHAPDVTELFEIVFPENRIVVDYGDKRELIHLATIEKRTGADLPRTALRGIKRAPSYGQMDLEELAARTDPNREGFVVTYQSGHRIKVKLAEYVRLHKIVTGVNARMIWEHLRDGDSFDAILDGIPDELFAWIEQVRGDLVDEFSRIETDALRVYENALHTTNRKALAGHFKDSGANPSVLFRMLDGKPYADLIWKAIKPEPMTPQGPPLNAVAGSSAASATEAVPADHKSGEQS
jgi:RNA ligase